MPAPRPTGRLLVACAAALLLVGAGAVALTTRDAPPDAAPTATPAPTPSPTPSVGFDDYVAPVLPSVGPEALLPAGPGWAITQVTTDGSEPLDVHVLYLTSPAGDAVTLALPDGVTVERLVDWLPGTTLAVVATDLPGASPREETHSVVDLATGAVLSSRSSGPEGYVETRFVGAGTTDVVAVTGPRAHADAGAVEHVATRSTADGQERARSAAFALETGIDSVVGTGIPLSVSSDGAYVLTDGPVESRVLDASTLAPAAVVLPPAPAGCYGHRWLGARSIAVSCVAVDDHADGELWRVAVGGDPPDLMLDSTTLAERGDVAGTYLVGGETVVDFRPYFGEGDGFPAGLYRVDAFHGDLVRLAGQDDGPDAPRRYLVHGVAGDRLLVVASEAPGFRSLLLVDRLTGAAQPLVPDLAVDGMRVRVLVADG